MRKNRCYCTSLCTCSGCTNNESSVNEQISEENNEEEDNSDDDDDEGEEEEEEEAEEEDGNDIDDLGDKTEISESQGNVHEFDDELLVA